MDLFQVLSSETAIDPVASFLIKGTLLSLLLIAVSPLLRRASSAVRAAWWTTGALGVISIPLLGALLPVWAVGPFSYPFGTLARPVAGASVGGSIPTFGGVLLVVWAAGASLLLLRLLTATARIAWSGMTSDSVEGTPLGTLARTIRVRMGLPRGIRVVLSDQVEIPCTWGLRQPVVLLPSAAVDWPRERQRAVLHHEFAHVARGDYMGLLWLELARVVYWPNPFAWLVHREGRHEQERACDDAALAAGIPPVEYARHLIAVGRDLLDRTPPAGALPLVRRGSLRERVASLLETDTDRRPATAYRLLLTGAVIALIAAPVAAASPQWVCYAAAPTHAPTPAVTETAPAADALSPPVRWDRVPPGAAL